MAITDCFSELYSDFPGPGSTLSTVYPAVTSHAVKGLSLIASVVLNTQSVNPFDGKCSRLAHITSSIARDIGSVDHRYHTSGLNV